MMTAVGILIFVALNVIGFMGALEAGKGEGSI